MKKILTKMIENRLNSRFAIPIKDARIIAQEFYSILKDYAYNNDNVTIPNIGKILIEKKKSTRVSFELSIFLKKALKDREERKSIDANPILPSGKENS